MTPPGIKLLYTLGKIFFVGTYKSISIKQNAILGISYREGQDDTDISNQGTKVKIKSQNITTYTSWRSSNNNSIDFYILGNQKMRI